MDSLLARRVGKTRQSTTAPLDGRIRIGTFASGLRAYGFHEEATRIAMKWMRLISDEFTRSGAIRERHNVVDPNVPPPGRYPPQRGFGWTNSVFVVLLVRVIYGVEILGIGDQAQLRPCFPQEWVGKKIELTLPNYPWPDGAILSEVAA